MITIILNHHNIITKDTTLMSTLLPTRQYQEKAISVSRGWRNSAPNLHGIFSHRS